MTSSDRATGPRQYLNIERAEDEISDGNPVVRKESPPVFANTPPTGRVRMQGKLVVAAAACMVV